MVLSKYGDRLDDNRNGSDSCPAGIQSVNNIEKMLILHCTDVEYTLMLCCERLMLISSELVYGPVFPSFFFSKEDMCLPIQKSLNMNRSHP